MRAPRIFGHPLHPITTHLPIGILLLSVFCDIAAVVTTRDSWDDHATFLLIAGLFSAVPTVMSGMMELQSMDSDSPLITVLSFHIISAVGALSAFGVSLAFRMSSETSGFAAYIASACGMIALLLTGRFGGDLVYQYGHGVQELENEQIEHGKKCYDAD